MQVVDQAKIQSVIYEMPQLGVKVIPFDESKSIKDYQEMFPDSLHFAFSQRPINEIADIYDKIIAWISPERSLSEQELEENKIELGSLLKEALISKQRYNILLTAIIIRVTQSQSRENNA